MFSYINSLTASSKLFVLVSNICFRGHQFQIYYFLPSPTFTSTMFMKRAAAITNDPISHVLRPLEHLFCCHKIDTWTAD